MPRDEPVTSARLPASEPGARGLVTENSEGARAARARVCAAPILPVIRIIGPSVGCSSPSTVTQSFVLRRLALARRAISLRYSNSNQHNDQYGNAHHHKRCGDHHEENKSLHGYSLSPLPARRDREFEATGGEYCHDGTSSCDRCPSGVAAHDEQRADCDNWCGNLDASWCAEQRLV